MAMIQEGNVYVGRDLLPGTSITWCDPATDFPGSG